MCVHLYVCMCIRMTNFFYTLINNNGKSNNNETQKLHDKKKAESDDRPSPNSPIRLVCPFCSSVCACLRVDVSTYDAWVLHNARELPLALHTLSGSLASLLHTRISFYMFFLALQSIIELWLWKLEQDPNFFTA